MANYKILRFFKDFSVDTELIKDGLTLEEAQEHCKREDTQGETWFDGYIAE